MDFTLDRAGLVFCSFALVISCWAVFDTERFLRLLSYNRRRDFPRSALMVIRVPGTICILGLTWMLLVNLFQRLFG